MNLRLKTASLSWSPTVIFCTDMNLYIELKLYRHEALHLFNYLEKKRKNLEELKGAAADADFVLVEWLLAKYWSKATGIELRCPQKPTKIKIPTSVARILWKNWQQEFIPDSLQIVLQGIDGQLKNNDLSPLNYKL